jgi:nucleoside 2-deoxyribosyltransferase
MSTLKVFISYSHSDREWASRFAETMASSGVAVFFDESGIAPGQSLVEGLEKGLRESDAMVLLLNAENVKSPNIAFEIGAAYGMNKAIIPIVSKGFEHKLPLHFQRAKFLVRNSPEETAKEVMEALYGEAA